MQAFPIFALSGEFGKLQLLKKADIKYQQFRTYENLQIGFQSSELFLYSFSWSKEQKVTILFLLYTKHIKSHLLLIDQEYIFLLFVEQKYSNQAR